VGGATNSFVSGAITPADGLLGVVFRNTNGSKITAWGTLLQNTNQAGGFFPGATNAGTMTLAP
jgi:hypothetical protein